MTRLLLFIFLLGFSFAAQAQKGPTATGTVPPIIRIFPNPATSFVNLDFVRSVEKGYTLQVYNFLGRKMFEAAANAGRTAINLTDYQRGMYVYQLRDRSGKMIETGKFQVSK